eukprot:scaffold316_cov352-Pavlova_lutheri.AAC.37
MCADHLVRNKGGSIGRQAAQKARCEPSKESVHALCFKHLQRTLPGVAIAHVRLHFALDEIHRIRDGPIHRSTQRTRQQGCRLLHHPALGFQGAQRTCIGCKHQGTSRHFAQQGCAVSTVQSFPSSPSGDIDGSSEAHGFSTCGCRCREGPRWHRAFECSVRQVGLPMDGMGIPLVLGLQPALDQLCGTRDERHCRSSHCTDLHLIPMIQRCSVLVRQGRFHLSSYGEEERVHRRHARQRRTHPAEEACTCTFGAHGVSQCVHGASRCRSTALHLHFDGIERMSDHDLRHACRRSCHQILFQTRQHVARYMTALPRRRCAPWRSSSPTWRLSVEFPLRHT